MPKLKIENPVENVASQFITMPRVEPAEEKLGTDQHFNAQKPVPLQNKPKNDKNGKELKRKRYNLLFLPSLFDNIEKIAYVQKTSVNEAVNQAIEFYCNANKNLIEKYTQIEKLKAAHETEE